MEKSSLSNNKKNKTLLYKCPECGLLYEDEKMEKLCQDWCEKYHTCNVDIIKHSLQSKSKKHGK